MTDFEPAVREYLRYCRRAAAELKLQGSSLDKRFHPTADGAVKMIPHNGVQADAKLIREAYVKVTSSDEKGTAA